MATFKIERLNRRTGEWTQTQHTREGKTANEAVCQFVVSRSRGHKGTAVTKSGKTYRAVA